MGNTEKRMNTKLLDVYYLDLSIKEGSYNS